MTGVEGAAATSSETFAVVDVVGHLAAMSRCIARYCIAKYTSPREQKDEGRKQTRTAVAMHGQKSGLKSENPKKHEHELSMSSLM